LHDFVLAALRIIGWATHFGLVFGLVRVIARRTNFTAGERKVLLYAVAFCGTIFVLLASNLIAGLLPEPFDLVVIAAVGIAVIAAFFAILTA
jgi:hypothetical protein